MRSDLEIHPRRQSASPSRKELKEWIPAFAGMTRTGDSNARTPSMFFARQRGQVPWLWPAFAGMTQGGIRSDGYSFIRDTPWMVVAGGIPLILTTLGFTFLGEALRDVFDPKLKKEG